MPRIRTLKPEHRQHRKVGPLSDRAYRLWVGMILESDDDGRLVADPAFLRASIFTYQGKLTLGQITAALEEIARAGLIRLYGHAGIQYADFPSWADHQRIDRKNASKLQRYDDSTSVRRTFDDDSTLVRGGSEGSEGSRSEGSDHYVGIAPASSARRKHSPRPEEVATEWSQAEWPSPEALAHAYNTLTPDNVPSVQALSEKRREKAVKMLRQFPDRQWWEDTFKRYHRSRFLSGRTTPRPGHEGFQPDFDWLLSNGKNGTENAVKVHDGNYR